MFVYNPYTIHVNADVFGLNIMCLILVSYVYVPFSLLFFCLLLGLTEHFVIYNIYIHYGCLALCCCVGFSLVAAGRAALWLCGTGFSCGGFPSCRARAPGHAVSNCDFRAQGTGSIIVATGLVALGMWDLLRIS